MISPRCCFPVLMVLLVSSCDPSMVYDSYMTTEDRVWRWNDVGVFDFEINDTVSLHNIYLQVRHTVDYPLSNLYMFVVLKGPSGQYLRDTVNIVLAAPDGSWTGKGTGKLRELRLLYRDHIRFSEPGTYSISLEQAMRRSELPVTDVGVRVERVNP
jgi:gliding motility-associated lipoprotein GldH